MILLHPAAKKSLDSVHSSSSIFKYTWKICRDMVSSSFLRSGGGKNRSNSFFECPISAVVQSMYSYTYIRIVYTYMGTNARAVT